MSINYILLTKNNFNMKKITLLLILTIVSVFDAYAQFPEGFETSVPPTGWATFIGINGEGTVWNWEQSTTIFASGAASAFVRYENVATGAEDWLVTPQFTPTAATNILSFQQRQAYSSDYGTTYTVRVSIASQTTHGDFAIIDTQTELDFGVSFASHFVDLSAYDGMPIYVAFVMSQDDGDNWYIDDVDLISNATAPGCSATPIPTDLATNVLIPGGSLTLSWDAPTTGDPATDYEFFFGTVSGSLSSLATVSTPTIDLINLVFSNTYYWMVVPGNVGGSATGCAEWSFTTEAAPPPPANDDCSGAIVLTPGALFETNPLTGNNVSTTDSGETAPGCASYSGGDLWYSVVVPPDGNITLETDSNPTGSGGDSGAAAYSGSCGSLVLISCNDDGGNGLYSQVVITNAMGLAGQTIYFRVWEYGNNATINFQVSAYSATLGLGDNKIEGFKLYPNPANDILNFSAQQTINDVRIYSLLGQEVMRIQPNTIKSQVDISNLSTGMYVVKVQVGDKIGSYRIIKQ